MNFAGASDTSGRPRSFSIERTTSPSGSCVLALRGQIRFLDAGALWSELAEHEAALTGDGRVELDLSGLSEVDGGSMALLVHLRSRLVERGVPCEFVQAEGRVAELVELYGGHVRVERPPRRRARGLLDQIGAATLEIGGEMKRVLGFLGELMLETVRAVRRPSSVNVRDVPPLVERTGADAVPVVLLLNLLVGMVMAFQAAQQLKRFGANILVADLLGISVTRELGPLITAIVVAGRSGAAFAAELGTMKVNEEIDALRTMGFGPMPFLVMPRVLTLMVTMPLLSVLADVVGVLGGMLVGMAALDLTPVAYWHQTQKAVDLWDLWTGLIKSVPFGLAIGLIACQQGLATEGGAEGVGQRTTSAVVITLFCLISLDAIFTVFFRAVGV
jgi:phospholipid/cholesterol/gamma-HCH transport system permease protein